MNLELTSEEIIDLLDGRLAVGMMSDRVGPIKTDTRESVKDSWFLALNGPKYDGHDFIGEAFSSGAIGCIVNERTGYPIAETSFPLIAVENTTLAYGRLARNWRKRLGFKVALVISEDRDESSSVSNSLGKELRLSADLIDTRLMRIEHCFDKMLAMTNDKNSLVVNLVPANLADANLLIDSLAADVVCVIGEPFGYLRLFEAKEDIEATLNLLYEQMSKNGGTIVWGSSCLVPSVISKSSNCKLITDDSCRLENDKRTESGSESSKEMAESGGIINMQPDDEISNANSLWCVEQLVKLIEPNQKSISI